jgi:CRISPR-associated protein Csx17
MDRLQYRSRDKNAPARLVHAERRLADAVFAALTHDHTSERWQAILLAAADIETLQVAGTAIEAGPIPQLRPEWVSAVDDRTPETRLALALGSAASDYYKYRPIDPVRHHWLPLERDARRFKTADKRLVNDPRVVMSGRDALRDCSAIVERRLIEAAMRGERRSRLVAARGCDAQLGDLAEFLQGRLDIDRILGLARAFMAIKWDRWSPELRPHPSRSAELPDESWLAIRLASLPWPLTREKDIPNDPRIIRLLSSHDSARAVDIALKRLGSVGIRPPLQAGLTNSVSSELWAAALVFPISHRSAMRAAAILDPSMKGRVNA